MEQRLLETEQRIKKKFRDENMRKKGTQISNTDLEYQIQVDSKTTHTQGTVLDEYVVHDKFGQHKELSNLEEVMFEYAVQLKDFNLKEMSKHVPAF